MSPHPTSRSLVEPSSAHLGPRLALRILAGLHPRRFWHRRLSLALRTLVVALMLGSSALRAEPGGPPPLGDLARWQRQALRSAELDRRSQRELEARLRLAVLLPQLRVTWGRGTQWVYSSRSDLLSEPVPDGDRSNYSVSLSWDLGRLLWSPEDLTLHRLAPRLAAERRQILLQVAALYLRLCQSQQESQRSSARVAAAASQQTTALQIALQAVVGEEANSRSLPHCPEHLPDAASLSAIETGRPLPAATLPALDAAAAGSEHPPEP